MEFLGKPALDLFVLHVRTLIEPLSQLVRQAVNAYLTERSERTSSPGLRSWKIRTSCMRQLGLGRATFDKKAQLETELPGLSDDHFPALNGHNGAPKRPTRSLSEPQARVITGRSAQAK